MRVCKNLVFQLLLTVLFTSFTACFPPPSLSLSLQNDVSTPTLASTSSAALHKEMVESFFNGNIERVGVVSEELLKRIPDNGDAHAMQAISLCLDGNIPQARGHYTRARELQADTSYLITANALFKYLAHAYPEAEKLCQQAIQAAPNHPYPWSILGKIQTDLGNYAKAKKSYDTCIALNANFNLAYINSAALAYAMGKLNESLQLYNTAWSKNPNSSTTCTGLAQTQEALGKTQAAIDTLQKCRTLAPENKTVIEKLSTLYLKQEKYDKAIEFAQQIPPLNARDSSLLLGKIYLQQAKVDEARYQLEKIAEKNDEVMYLLSYCSLASSDYRSALQLLDQLSPESQKSFLTYYLKKVASHQLDIPFDDSNSQKQTFTSNQKKFSNFSAGCNYLSSQKPTRAYKLFSSSSQSTAGFLLYGINEEQFKNFIKANEGKHLDLGVFLLSLGYNNLSLKQFNTMIALNKDSFLGNYLAAQAYLRKNDRFMAKKYLTRAVEIVPDFFTALYTLGEINFIEGKFDTAAEYYTQAARVHADPGILIKLGLYFEHSKKVTEAAAQYQKVVSSFPNYYVGYNQLAWLYAKNKMQLDTALKLAKKADSLQPGNASILDTLGWIYYQKQEFSKAVENFNKAIEISAASPTFHYHLGATYIAMKKIEQGKHHLNRAIELSENFEEFEEAKKLLKQISNQKDAG
nr:tetratricopeptide repeat protein [uncultured Desulfobulbus sp.]